MDNVITVDEKTLKILKSNMVNDLFNYMTDEQRKEMFEFIEEHYDFKTGKKK